MLHIEFACYIEYEWKLDWVAIKFCPQMFYSGT